MASSHEYVTWLCDQLVGAGRVAFKKMFGEYALYLNGKLFALVCDDALFVKITEAGRALMPGLSTAPPYKGAKPYFAVEDVDDREALCALARVTCEALPEPRSK